VSKRKGGFTKKGRRSLPGSLGEEEKPGRPVANRRSWGGGGGAREKGGGRGHVFEFAAGVELGGGGGGGAQSFAPDESKGKLAKRKKRTELPSLPSSGKKKSLSPWTAPPGKKAAKGNADSDHSHRAIKSGEHQEPGRSLGTKGRKKKKRTGTSALGSP